MTAPEIALTDRRQNPRYEAEGTIFVAPYKDEIPTLSGFSEVALRDMSRSGCSFVLPERPTTSKMVVAIEGGERSMLLLAHVMNVREDDDYVVIGCRFLSRLR